MSRAVAQRPDLLAQVESVRAGEAETKRVRSAYYPEITFSGEWGHSNSFGEQKNFGSSAESRIFPYQAQLKIRWRLFDAGARRNQVAQSRAEVDEARDRLAASREDAENEIWAAYANLKTAQQQDTSARALLESAQASYDSATEAFRLGVRTFVDVTTAQRSLARARTAQAAARVRLLSAVANFAFRAGDPIPGAQH